MTGVAEWCGAFRIAERMAGWITDADFATAHAAMGERLATVGRKGEGEH